MNYLKIATLIGREVCKLGKWRGGCREKEIEREEDVVMKE